MRARYSAWTRLPAQEDRAKPARAAAADIAGLEAVGRGQRPDDRAMLAMRPDRADDRLGEEVHGLPGLHHNDRSYSAFDQACWARRRARRQACGGSGSPSRRGGAQVEVGEMRRRQRCPDAPARKAQSRSKRRHKVRLARRPSRLASSKLWLTRVTSGWLARKSVAERRLDLLGRDGAELEVAQAARAHRRSGSPAPRSGRRGRPGRPGPARAAARSDRDGGCHCGCCRSGFRLRSRAARVRDVGGVAARAEGDRAAAPRPRRAGRGRSR